MPDSLSQTSYFASTVDILSPVDTVIGLYIALVAWDFEYK
jgi:hypothetical protein